MNTDITKEQAERLAEDVLRAAFESDASPYGFDLTRKECAAPEPWSEYLEMETGMRWGGFIAGYEAALTQQAGVNAEGWRSMESAPKDGTVIDLWVGGFEGRQADCYWGLPFHTCGGDGMYCDSDWHDLNDGWVQGTVNHPLFDEPTHWRPLPQSPAAAPSPQQQQAGHFADDSNMVQGDDELVKALECIAQLDAKITTTATAAIIARQALANYRARKGEQHA